MVIKDLSSALKKIQDRIYTTVTINDATIDIIEVDFEDPAGAGSCPVHTHTWFEFNYVTSGYFFTTIGNTMLKVEEGMFFLIPPGVEHSHSYVQKNPHNGFFMRWSIHRNKAGDHDSDSKYDEKPNDNNCSVLDAKPNNTRVFKQLEKLYAWDNGSYKDNGKIKGLFEIMLVQASEGASVIALQLDFLNILFALTDMVGEVNYYEKTHYDFHANALLRKVDLYLNHVLYMPFNVHSLAASLHMSYGNLARLYKKYSGQTLQDRRTDILLDKSLLLLENTDYSIKEISEKLGFANQFYFSRVFKSKKGITPTEYRGRKK